MNKAVRRGVGTTLALACLVVVFALWWRGSNDAAAIAGLAPKVAYGVRPLSAGSARDLEPKLRDAIVARPLDQDLVNGYYTLISSTGIGTPAQRDQWLGKVASLGWQSSPAQMNLLMHAVQGGDMEAVLDRTEAMMRRERLEDRFAAVLYLVEQAPQTQSQLIARLRANAPWRGFFFANAAGLATPGGRRARADTLGVLFASASYISRHEVAPFLAASRDAGELDQADRVWRMFRQQRGEPAPSAGRAFDPEFKTYSSQPSSPQPVDLPFEWEPLSGPGYSTDIDRGTARFDWDGSGVPILLRQTLRAQNGRYRAIVRGADVGVFLEHFELGLDCPNDKVRFNSQAAPKGDTATLVTDRPVLCPFPTVVVRGRPSLLSQPIGATLESIAVQPVG